MSVQFIVGPSGTGKTRYIYDKMISESMEENHPPVIFVLPEQSNMGAEKDMIFYHPNGGTMDISIVSFTRLSFQIFDKDNVYTADILDDYGKSMLVMKVLREHAGELVYYGNMLGRQGFVDEVKSILSEFYQYQITVGKLDDIIGRLSKDNSLYYKLSDIRIIMQGFEEAMGNTYMVAEQMLSLLASHIEETDTLANASIYFDGFTGFTPVQYEVISRMMRKCGSLYFTITIDKEALEDNSYEEEGLFKMGREMASKLSRIAYDNGVDIRPHIALTNNHRFKCEGELAHLERNIFRFPIEKYNPDNSYDFNGDADNKIAENNTDEKNVNIDSGEIEIIEADNTEAEILFVGRRIHTLVRNDGYRFRDIAVITGDLEDNNEVWKRIMERLEIPYFLDVNEPLLHNQIVELISMVFDLFDKDFSFDAVFSFLKTGVLDIDLTEIYMLENYALQYGVRGYSWWSKPFKGGKKGLKHINKIRQEFINSIKDLYPVLSKNENSAIEYIKAVYAFLSGIQYGKRLWRQANKLEELGETRRARVYENAFDKLLQVLDKTVDIAGEDIVSRKALSDMLLTGLSDMKLGILPATLDQVLIGDMERTRLHHVKVLFVAGANEGLLPKSVSGGGIISDRDRDKLKEMDVDIAPGGIDKYYIQQYYLYMQMTSTAHRLIVSYRNNDNKGNAINKAFFVKYILQMFPYKRVAYGKEILAHMLPFTRGDMLHELSKQMSEESFDDPSLYHLLSRLDKENINRLISGYLYMNQPGKLNEVVAEKLYGNRMVHSVSRLEAYTSCQYYFFLQYGLNIRRPEEYRVRNNDIGIILHVVMEGFFAGLKNMGVDYSKESMEKNNINEEYIANKVEELTVAAAKKFDETIFDSSFRMHNQLRVITRIAKRSVDNLLRHLEAGEMKPEYFEKKFSKEDELKYVHMAIGDGITMDMSGIIDRVDIKETDDAVYVKVIDYKSGNKDIDYIEMVEGRQLQLAVYMSVMLEFLEKKYPNKKIVPSGMYYYQLEDKLVDGSDDDKLEKNRIKESRMTGLVTDDENCLEYLDHKTGAVVPVLYKDGSLSARNTHVVSETELRAISDFTRNKMIEIGTKIIHGQINMRPRKGNSSPCNFCDYRSICRFEAGLGGNNYAIGSKYDKEQAKSLIFANNSEKNTDTSSGKATNGDEQ